MLKKTVASAYKAKGKRVMDRKELTYTLSFDLKYFSHETSKKVVETAEKRGLLKSENDMLAPAFDLESIEISPDFKPDVNKIFKSESVFDEIVERICQQTGMSRGEVVKEVNRKQIELGNVLDVEVVSLIVALDKGVDVGDVIPKVKEHIYRQ